MNANTNLRERIAKALKEVFADSRWQETAFGDLPDYLQAYWYDKADKVLKIVGPVGLENDRLREALVGYAPERCLRGCVGIAIEDYEHKCSSCGHIFHEDIIDDPDLHPADCKWRKAREALAKEPPAERSKKSFHKCRVCHRVWECGYRGVGECAVDSRCPNCQANIESDMAALDGKLPASQPTSSHQFNPRPSSGCDFVGLPPEVLDRAAGKGVPNESPAEEPCDDCPEATHRGEPCTSEEHDRETRTIRCFMCGKVTNRDRSDGYACVICLSKQESPEPWTPEKGNRVVYTPAGDEAGARLGEVEPEPPEPARKGRRITVAEACRAAQEVRLEIEAERRKCWEEDSQRMDAFDRNRIAELEAKLAQEKGALENLRQRFANLGEMMGDPIGGDYCSLEKAVTDILSENMGVRAELEKANAGYVALMERLESAPVIDATMGLGIQTGKYWVDIDQYNKYDKWYERRLDDFDERARELLDKAGAFEEVAELIADSCRLHPDGLVQDVRDLVVKARIADAVLPLWNQVHEIVGFDELDTEVVSLIDHWERSFENTAGACFILRAAAKESSNTVISLTRTMLYEIADALEKKKDRAAQGATKESQRDAEGKSAPDGT